MAGRAQTDFPDRQVVRLRISVSQQGATTTIALDGEWDLAQREQVRVAVRNALAGQPDRMVLDLSRLTFMDSSGIHCVVELARKTAESGIGFTVLPGPRAVQRLFEICRLSESVPFADAA